MHIYSCKVTCTVIRGQTCLVKWYAKAAKIIEICMFFWNGSQVTEIGRGKITSVKWKVTEGLPPSYSLLLTMVDYKKLDDLLR